MLALLWAFAKLWQYGEFESLIDRFRPSRLQAINIDWLPKNKIEIEKEGEILTEQIGPCSKVLTEGDDGRLHWKLSEEYLDRLNKAWDKCSVIGMSETPCVIDINEYSHEESPGEDLSGCRQKRQVKWSNSNSVFHFNTENNTLERKEVNRLFWFPMMKVSCLNQLLRKQPMYVCL